MKLRLQSVLGLCALFFSLPLLAAPASQLLPIPWKTDPPIVVDGDFSDWEIIPFARQIDQLHFHSKAALKAYQGARDASATVKLAWRNQGFFLAAWVKDDSFCQQYQGAEIYKGDHLELFMDFLPGINPQQKKFGAGQYQFGISPGNFKNLKPEIHLWHPRHTPVKSPICAAVRTQDGWAIEAFFAWPHPMKRYSRLGLEVWFSDTDEETPDLQKQVLALGNKNWKFGDRHQMQQWILADPDGSIPAAELKKSPQGLALGNFEIAKLTTLKKEFQLPAPPSGTVPVLQFSGRLNTHLPYAGYTHTLKIKINGHELNLPAVLNRPGVIRNFSGREAAIYSKRFGFLLPYTPKFLSLINWQKKFKTRVNLHDYELNLSPYAKTGKNVLEFNNISKLTYVALQDCRISWQLPPAEKKFRGAPTGVLPRIQPQQHFKTDYQVVNSTPRLTVKIKNNTYILNSKFSTPNGQWVSSSNRYFQHHRRIEPRAEAVVIHDTFTNLTDQILPLRQRHEIPLTPAMGTVKLYLNGLEAYPSPAQTQSFNFTTYASTGETGIGLVPLNNVFQLHAKNYIKPGNILGLCDENMALPPHQSITQSFAVIPVERPDYWEFVNAARRLLDTNFTLEGPFGGRAIVCHWKWTDQAHRDYIDVRTGKCPYIVINTYAGGNIFKARERIKIRRVINRYRKIFPDKKLLIYFHDQIGSFDEIQASDTTLSPNLIGQNGQPAFYGGSKNKRLFLPLPGSKMWNWELEKLRIFMDDFKMDGIFWDEMSFSALLYHYGPEWDKISADIDPVTGKLLRLKSAVPLLKDPFHEYVLKEMQKRGKFVYANGQLNGVARKFKIQTMAESEVRSNLHKMQLYTPCQFQRYMVPGMTFADHYLDMLDGLKRGVLFLWGGSIDPKKEKTPEYPTLTEHMYPFTPMELHSGYLIGQERIVSCVSGTFGWGDNSRHEVYVYDNFGSRVAKPNTRIFTENGQTWTDLRLAENYSAVIVRHK